MSSLLVLCCLFAGVLGSDVLPATADNFESLVKQHPHVLAQFSAPWCGHCKNLAPEFESAATTLKTADPPVALIQIDATVDKALAEKYDVKGFPTLRWIHSGEAAEFTGGRDAASIVAWCKKKSGAPSTELVDPKAVDEFASQATAVLLGLMDPDAPEWGEFIKVASTLDEIPVGHTSHEAVVKQHAPAKVVMLQKFDDGLQKYSGAMTAPEMKRWARANALPLVTEFTRETQPRIFADSAPSKHLLALHPAKYGEKDGMVAVLREVAANHKGEVLAITVEENSDNSGVFNFFGVKADDVKASPRVVGIDQIGTAMKKYFFTGTVAEPALSQWVEDWLSGKVSPTLKSATPPIESENQEPVRIVVGSTFKREVIQSAKDTMVQFYAPWCGHCKSFAHQYDKLGMAFQKISSVKIVKVDATQNEVEEVEVKGFPTFWFFPATDPTNPVLYEGPRTLGDMEEFIKKNVAIPLTTEGHSEL